MFLLGSRYCETDRLSKLRGSCSGRPPAAGPRQGDLRLRPSPHAFGYQSARPTKTAWKPTTSARRVPRLCPSGDRLLPLSQHTGAILHRLSRRHRRPARRRANGFRGLVRSLRGRRLVHIRCPRNNVPRIGRVLIARGRRCRRCCDQHDIRSHRSSPASKSGPTTSSSKGPLPTTPARCATRPSAHRQLGAAQIHPPDLAQYGLRQIGELDPADPLNGEVRSRTNIRIDAAVSRVATYRPRESQMPSAPTALRVGTGHHGRLHHRFVFNQQTLELERADLVIQDLKTSSLRPT